jgi:hypothetical protein
MATKNKVASAVHAERIGEAMPNQNKMTLYQQIKIVH